MRKGVEEEEWGKEKGAVRALESLAGLGVLDGYVPLSIQ